MDDTMWSALERERLGLASLLEELTPPSGRRRHSAPVAVCATWPLTWR